MESEQPASQEESRLDDPKPNVCEESGLEPVKESHVNTGSYSNSDISCVVTDEVLRYRIRALIDEKPKPSKWHIVTTNPMATVVAGFILSAVIGGFLTYYYGKQQQEITARRSFSDELHKVRIQKLGEVWERIDQNEVMLDILLDRVNKAPGSTQNKEDFDKIEKLLDEDVAIISKNRFWLGEPDYRQLKNHLDITGQYAFDMLLGQPGINLKETLKKREQGKQDILQIRTQFLKGEP